MIEKWGAPADRKAHMLGDAVRVLVGAANHLFWHSKRAGSAPKTKTTEKGRGRSLQLFWRVLRSTRPA